MKRNQDFRVPFQVGTVHFVRVMVCEALGKDVTALTTDTCARQTESFGESSEM